MQFWCTICSNGIFRMNGHVLERCHVCNESTVCKFQHFDHYCQFCERYDLCKNVHLVLWENGYPYACKTLEPDQCIRCLKKFHDFGPTEHTPICDCDECGDPISECSDHFYSSCDLCGKHNACADCHNSVYCRRCRKMCCGLDRPLGHESNRCGECDELVYECDPSACRHFYGQCPLCRVLMACRKKHNIPICNLCSTRGCNGKLGIDPMFFQHFQCKRCHQPVYSCCMGGRVYPYCPRCDGSDL